jgi:hypothetical protein
MSKRNWNSWTYTPTCGFYTNLMKNVMEEMEHYKSDGYNFTPYIKALKETCDAEFSCTHEEIESLWKRFEKKYNKELSTAVDLAANPSSIDLTISSAYFTFMFIYFGISDHDVHCLTKTSDGSKFINSFIYFKKLYYFDTYEKF